MRSSDFRLAKRRAPCFARWAPACGRRGEIRRVHAASYDGVYGAQEGLAAASSAHRLHRDDDLAPRVAALQVSDRLGDVAQREALADDGDELARREQLPHEDERLPVRLRHEHAHAFPSDERRRHGGERRPEHAPRGAPDVHVGALGLQRAQAIRDRAERRRVDDEIVERWLTGEVLTGVVDDPVGSDRAHEVDVPRAAHARHLGAERLRDLHGERAHASRRAVDEDLRAGPDPPLVAQRVTAVTAASGTAAACSKVTFAGFRTRARSRTLTYSANAPHPQSEMSPNTSSPTASSFTSGPIASTVPATSAPSARA